MKPKHLSAEYAAQFKDNCVVAAHAHRPPIPRPVFEALERLIDDTPRVVLDAGCGTGAMARLLAPHVKRVDAIDFSPAMIAVAQQLPGNAHPNLRWITGSMEDAPLDPPYALVVAAGSLHWMNWAVVLPRFRDTLTARGTLAIVWQSEVRQPWSDTLVRLIQQYSTNQEHRAFNLIETLVSSRLFRPRGEVHTEPEPFSQTIAGYVESIHSRDGFSRERMTPEAAAAFDAAVTSLLQEACPTDTVELEIVGHVV